MFKGADLGIWIAAELQEQDSPPGFESESEGLTLNVWTPAKPNVADECKRPVLVYLCGADHQTGPYYIDRQTSEAYRQDSKS